MPDAITEDARKNDPNKKNNGMIGSVPNVFKELPENL